MASIDERVVAMSFENAKFEAGIAQTMRSITKLNQAIASMGSVNGLDNIEKAANKVTLQAPMTALDKLKQRLFGASTGAAEGFSGIDAAGNKVTLQGPTSALDRLRTRLFGASTGAAQGMAGIENAGNQVHLTGPIGALDKLRTRLFGIGTGSVEGFASIERSGNQVHLTEPIRATQKVQSAISQVGQGAAASFGEIEKAGNHVTFGGVQRAAQATSHGFSAMQLVATGAIGGVAATAAIKGKDIAKSLTLGPVTQGFQEYGTNLKSIQTILANTQFQGTNLKQVNGALNELNHYSDQTIYNFSEMAKNIGTFTAAGVDLKTATGSIKGIANLAALSGSNSEQASTAMYQLSQAISSGRVSLQDWNSVVNAGMGGAVFQRALAQTGVAMGTIDKAAVKIDKSTGKATINGKSFRESITAKPGQKSWLTDKVLTTALKNFTGDLTLAQIKAEGFTTEQAKGIQKIATAAKKAATESKTLGDVFNVVKEAIGSGWSASFMIIFGNFKEAKKMFTDLATYFQNIIGAAAKTRNKILQDWKDLGGRTQLIEGIKTAWHSLGTILKPIKDAFRDIFPRKTGKDLYDLTLRFKEFAKQLAIGPETAKNLKRTFRGLFAMLDIGKTIIFGVAKMLAHLFGIATGGGGILSLTGSFGDFVVALDKGISKGKGFAGVFKGLGNVLRTPIELIKGIASAIAGLFGVHVSTDAGKKLGENLATFKKALGPLGKAVDFVQGALSKLFHLVDKVKTALTPFFNTVVHVFSTIGNAVINGIKQINYDKVMQALQVGLTGGIAVGLRKLTKGLGLNISGGIGVGLNKGTLDAVTKVTSALTTNLKTMQRTLNATTLLLIAAAILALAVAAGEFAKIDGKKLVSALTGMAVAMGELVASLKVVSLFGKGALGLPFIAAGMLLVAGAMVVMGHAVQMFATMSWGDMIKGLSGVAGALVTIGLTSKLMGPDLLYIGPGLLGVALALNVLGVALKIMASMSWEELLKGLLGIGTSIGILAFALVPMIGAGPELILVGAGLGIMAGGLILLAAAVSSFGAISILDTAKGIYTMALAIKVLATSLEIIPMEGMAVKAAGIGLLAASMILVAGALRAMGSMDLATIGKGLVTMAAALFELSVGLTIMEGTGGGALALLAAAAALAILAPVLITLGALKWMTIVKGLVAIAGAMLVIGGLGAVVAEPMIVLGIALGTIAAAALLGSAAIWLFSLALENTGNAGGKAFAVLMTSITAFIALLPTMAINFIKGLVDIMASLATLAPKIATSIVSIVQTFASAIIQLQPQALALIGMLLNSLIILINKYAVPLVNAGFHLFMAFLNGIANNIGHVTTAVARIVGGFLGALATRMPAIIANGGRLLINFLRGVIKQLPGLISVGARAVRTFLTGVTQAMPGIVAKGIALIVTFINSVARHVGSIYRAGVNLIIAVINGIAAGIPRIIHAGTNLVIKFMKAIANELPRLADQGFKAVIKFLNGIADAIRNNQRQLWDAGFNIASAIGEGIMGGFSRAGPLVKHAVEKLAGLLPHWVKKILGIHSPSKVMMAIGGYAMEGMANGITQGGKRVNYALTNVTDNVVGLATDALHTIPAALNNMGHLNPTITPVLDLSAVEREAQRLNALTRVDQIDPASSYYNADAIAALEAAAMKARIDQPTDASQPMVKLEQNNYSPESLSEIEIYRQTQNQLSQVKKALAKA